jgi:hypothetical protein
VAILIVWIISISLAAVQLYVGRIEEVKGEEASATLTTTTTNMSTIRDHHLYDGSVSVSNLVTPTTAAEHGLESSPEEKIYTCNEAWGSEYIRQKYTLFIIFAVYIIPVFILGYTYTCIICIIKQTTHPGNANASRDMMYNKSKNKVVKMLIILVCVFTICW